VGSLAHGEPQGPRDAEVAHDAGAGPDQAALDAGAHEAELGGCARRADTTIPSRGRRALLVTADRRETELIGEDGDKQVRNAAQSALADLKRK